MAKRRPRPLISLAVTGIVLLAACGGGAGGAVSDALNVQSDTTTPGTSVEIPSIAKPSGPAPTATPQARGVSIALTGTVAPTPTTGGSSTATPADSPSSGPGPAAVMPTSSAMEPTATVEPPLNNITTPTPATSPEPTATPTPSQAPTPAPPDAPGAPTAGVTRATGFVPLDQPRFVPAAQAQGMTGESLVLGLDWRGETRAYPLSMMWFHHIANDNINGWPVLVTY